MSLIGIIVLLIVVCVVIWAARAILTAFNVQDPIKTVVWVLIVLVCVLALADQTGILGGGGFHLGRLGGCS
jgi:hypothetical protein